MVFSGTTFLFLFLPLLLLFYFPCRNIRWRNGVLLVFSLLFYSWGEPVWVLGMVVITAINYALSLAIVRRGRQKRKKLYLTLAVILSLVMLVYFKYAAFFINSFCSLLGFSYRMEAQRLPIGISFYTFQVLTYTVDVYHKKAAPQKSYFRTLLYISCFPQLIAGPIVQYADVAEELGHRRTSPKDFYQGMQRFVLGLSKKVLLANLCGQMLESGTLAGTGTALSVTGAWLGALLYSMQLYFDFSAYSDMAIGLGRVLGFHYKENFNHPYVSASVTEFWRRWHMSLSGFFRDYVYIPLGGNRRGTGRTILNMLVVWSLTGLWHGASWNFILWGLYYFVFLTLEKYVFRSVLERIPGFFRHLLTLIVIAAGWVIFYYTDLNAVGQHLLALFGLAKNGDGLYRIALIDSATLLLLKQYSFYPLLAVLCCLPLADTFKERLSRTGSGEVAYHVLTPVLLTALLAISVVMLLGQTYNPFIYFRF